MKKRRKQNKLDGQQITEKRLRRTAIILGALVSLLGITVLFGWQYNIRVLEVLALGFAPMNPLAAILFILAGAAIISAGCFSSRLSRWITFILALLIVVLAGLKLLNLTGVNVPIDQIIFAQKLGNFQPPSRVPPIAAINFLLIGLAIIFLQAKKIGLLAAQFSAFIVSSFGLLMVMAYAFGTSFNSTIIFFSPLALHGAVSFMALGVAILFLKPRSGLMSVITDENDGGIFARALLPYATILPVIFGYLGVKMVELSDFDYQFSAALVLTFTIVLMEVIIWLYARRINRLHEDRKITQQEVVRAKSFDEALLESIGDAVVATDKNAKVLFFNQAAAKLSGIKGAEAIGKLIYDLWSVSDRDGNVIPREKRPLEIALTTGKKLISTVSNPYYYIRDSKKIPVVVTVTPIMYQGQIAGVIDVFHDITADVEIDQAKSEFVSFASHQLRAPSTAIAWEAEIFLNDYGEKLDSRQRSIIDEIYRQNRQITDLIEDFLNISKVEYGTAQVEEKPIPVIPIIESVLHEQFNLALSKKNIQAEEKYNRDICAINTDPALFRLIVTNLVSNAIKYTPPDGKIKIELSRHRAGEIIGGRKLAKEACVFTVADTGYGIPADEQDKIFTKFHRAVNVREKKIEGTGLGLYMVKLFLDKMGGEIWFESEENKGTKFFVRL